MEKWVKVAIGAVIAILSLSIVATSVYSMTQEKVREEVVTFEVLTESTVTSDTYDLLNNYGIINQTNVDNIKNIKVNSNTLIGSTVTFNGNQFSFSPDLSGNYDFILNDNDTISSDGYDIQVGDVWEITFEVTQPPVISGVTATLLSLIPILFIGGIVYFTLSKREI